MQIRSTQNILSPILETRKHLSILQPSLSPLRLVSQLRTVHVEARARPSVEPTRVGTIGDELNVLQGGTCISLGPHAQTDGILVPVVDDAGGNRERGLRSQIRDVLAVLVAVDEQLDADGVDGGWGGEADAKGDVVALRQVEGEGGQVECDA